MSIKTWIIGTGRIFLLMGEFDGFGERGKQINRRIDHPANVEIRSGRGAEMSDRAESGSLPTEDGNPTYGGICSERRDR